MRAVAAALSISLPLVTVGCTNSGGPATAEIAGFTEAQEQFRARATFENATRFRTNTRFENGVFSVESRRKGASPRTLTSAAHRQYEWATYPGIHEP